MNKLTGYFIVFLLLLLQVQVSGQSKYIDRAGHASFYSKAPLEDIEAHSHQALSLLEIGSGEIVASMLMKSFQFEKALMQEHFNENYVESHKYPKATFKGKVSGIDKVDLKKDGTHTLDVSGEITIHGVTKPLQIKADFTVDKGVLKARSQFSLAVKDFKIEVPKIVINNIAETVQVTVEFQYHPMNQ